MLDSILKKIFGTQNERELKQLQPMVERVNQLEAEMRQLTNSELAAKTVTFKERISNGESLESILPEAFAQVREVSVRTMRMRHFDVQLIGGAALHAGKIAEMKTGEGKTLTSTLPIYLNALTGRGVHVVTVNDYLAKRDGEWMSPIYNFLGMEVGSVVHGLGDLQRKQAYSADVTYGTNNEFGFDYLRDNMKFDLANYVQRDLHFAIVDEVDSILIDEARTPLIISGPSEDSTKQYGVANQIMPYLRAESHFTIDEKSKSATLSEDGVKKCEELLKIDNLYDPRNISILHHVNQALRAHHIYKLDVDYVINEGKIVIVDEFTGRLMPGRRWGDGLHQAVESKEGVRIESENQTLATITFQNYFRMYDKLAGMTGTADTEAEEFARIYNLEVLVVPTNKPMIREDRDDLIFKTEEAKFNAVVDQIKECSEKGQPVLVGTISIDKSEQLGEALKRKGVRHKVLNAKHHAQEAEIVSQAGRKNSVTISTNMAGRGTDIKLGGNPEAMALAELGATYSEEEFNSLFKKYEEQCSAEREEVIQAGGLFILGTERHESRRIDNQLRGRSGRQGDPGASCFYLSLDDNLLRIFGGDKIKGMMEKMGMEEDEVIEHRWLNRAIENAQRRVEEHNFSIRKNLLEYDDVMNQQRQQVYKLRREILGREEFADMFLDLAEQVVGSILDQNIPEKKLEEFDDSNLKESILVSLNLKLTEKFSVDTTKEDIGLKIFESVESEYKSRIDKYGAQVFAQVEKYILLTTLDSLWKDHLLQMDHLKEGVHLRGYAQKDPLVEYKREAYGIFTTMMHAFALDVVSKLLRVEIQAPEIAAAVDIRNERVKRTSDNIQAVHSESSSFSARPQMAASGGGGRSQALQSNAPIRNSEKVGRNDPCPCGSGKKYKKCHGA